MSNFVDDFGSQHSQFTGSDNAKFRLQIRRSRRSAHHCSTPQTSADRCQMLWTSRPDRPIPQHCRAFQRPTRGSLSFPKPGRGEVPWLSFEPTRHCHSNSILCRHPQQPRRCEHRSPKSHRGTLPCRMPERTSHFHSRTESYRLLPPPRC